MKEKKPMKDTPLITTSEAVKEHISKNKLSRLCHNGDIERVSRGVYFNPASTKELPIEYEDLFYTVLSIKHGVICLISALSYYDLTDEIPRKHWIAIPAANRPLDRSNIKFIRFRNHSLGLTIINVSGVEVKIYDKERTIIDSFRFLPVETAVKALKRYFSGTDIKVDKLLEYAKILRVKIRPYIEAVTINDR